MKDTVAPALRKIPPDVVFLAAFTLLCCAYEYGRVLHLRPQPHHIWRQTIGLSITKNFYDGTASFWEPQIDNLFLDDGHSGKAVGECPLLYYAVAQLWRATGPSEFVYRVFMLLLHAIGSYALFRTLRSYLTGGWWPLFVSCMYFTSPAIVYFAISFLTEVPALDLLLVAAWLLTLHQRTGGRRSLVLAGLVLGLAGALKLTAGMALIALFVTLVAERAWPGRSERTGRLFHRPGTSALSLLAGSAIILAWYAFSLHYNRIHGGGFSNQFAQPVWSLDPDVARRAWTFGTTMMPGQMFHWSVWALFAGALFVMLRHASAVPTVLLALNGSLILGALSFTVLWFVALDNHDYYFIIPTLAIVCLVATGLWVLQQRAGASAWWRWMPVPAVVLLLVNVLYARENMEFRTRGERELARTGWVFPHSSAELDHWDMTRYWQLYDLLTIEPFARSIGIRKTDLVVIMPDYTVCAGLYLSGQRGWQNLGMKGLLEDSATVARAVGAGARYLYVTDPQWMKRPYLRSFLTEPIGRYGTTRIFRLRE